jgi:SAM-dependent methyltransferase
VNIVYLPATNEWNEYSAFVQDLVQRYRACAICDVGGGANPVLPLQFIQENRLDCTILDISGTELAKAPEGYGRVVQDIEAGDFPFAGQYDLVVTKMLAEHLRNGGLFHKNVFSMLKPGGVAVHYFPTLYALPFLVNKLIPERLSSLLLDVFLPRDRYRQGKFPAYYSWCYGPTPAMLSMLNTIGFEILLFKGIFGSTYYSRIPVLRDLHRAYSGYLVKHPVPYLTSFAQLILRKPLPAGS